MSGRGGRGGGHWRGHRGRGRQRGGDRRGGGGGRRGWEDDDGGGRGRDEQGGRGRGRGRGRGGFGPPPGLTGREIGMWYAQRSRGKKREKEIQERGRVNMNEEQERKIKRMLREVEDIREETSQFTAPQKPRNLRQSEIMCQNFYSYMLKKTPQLDGQLREEFLESQKREDYQRMRKFREKLPSYDMQKSLLSLIRNNQVVVISGETGCGKTTQVPQFILDDHLERGEGSVCRVICTQPRRISAISVAERVAAERGERCGNNGSVGYQIRLENAFPRPQGCILYCTTGILLKWLESDKLLQTVSHVVLDEVHERDILSDFLLIVIKELLPKRPNLKLILMSATLKAELFSEYFGDAPMVNIPGFTFPVTEYYLEDILEMTGYQPPEGSSRRKEPVWVKYKRGKKAREEERKKEEEEQADFEDYIRAMRGTYSERVVDSLTTMDHDLLDLNLAAAIIKHISLNKGEGAILVFLPGWDQISKLHDQLTSQQFFASSKFIIIPLHSMMPTANQRQVFDRPPPGVRKIIIATNIAETSITIDDVVYVVNMGRAKEHNFDVERNISTLKAEWISKASAHQRRGRAGRVQDGECFHVYSQLKESQLEEYQLPEIQRTPLEELCLNIKTLKLGQIIPFISRALQPPDMRAVTLAISSLKQMNALDEEENLTALGHHLSRLPVAPRIGKMMLFGAMFCCLDPILTIATSLSWKDPFIIPLGKEKLADARRKELSNNTRSDHLMLCNAVRGWEEAREHGDDGSYCWHNFMSNNVLKMLDKMKGQYSDLLHELRFISHRSAKHPAANRNSENIQLVKAVLCAGLYPKVAHVYKVPHKMNRPPKLSTPEDGRVAIHPKSVNVSETNFTSKWLLYHLKLKSTSVFLHDTTMVEPYPLLFCGGKISWDNDHGHETVFIDDDIKFHCSQATADLVIRLREELDRVLERKITDPGPTDWRQDSHEGKVMRAIVDILVMEGDGLQEDDVRGYPSDHRHGNYHQDDDDDDDDDDDEYDDSVRDSAGRYGQAAQWKRRDDRAEGNRWRRDAQQGYRHDNQHRRSQNSEPPDNWWDED
ncbi:ATP-dependent DNA/RNA helicase DHX36-like [Diadema setosum]|uniref:ATP-dependent DNA/RNA helicase DHX36-like n=1 Tax=Diadema setosum TaxID=31175 RepID=UPI003B3B48DB